MAKAQNPEKFEQIKALKVAFITEQVALTPEEAEPFWPVYNRYEKLLLEQRNLRRETFNKAIKAKGGISNLTEAEAQKLIVKYREIEERTFRLKQEKMEAVQKILSAKKIMQLYKAEISFTKRLMQRLKKRPKR